jgi:hypothetical protein
LTIAASEYSEVHTGGKLPSMSSCRSSGRLVRYWMKWIAVAWCLEKALTARFAPPSELDPGPSSPGSRATPTFP